MRLSVSKDVTIYAGMKIAMKYMNILEGEQEFIEYLANLLIDLYARIVRLPCNPGLHRGDANSATHVKLAQLATWLAFSRLRTNLEQMIMTYTDTESVEQVLARVRTYVGDYRSTVSPHNAKSPQWSSKKWDILYKEIADLRVEGFAFELTCPQIFYKNMQGSEEHPMSVTVCPAAIVAAPVETVWEHLDNPPRVRRMWLMARYSDCYHKVPRRQGSNLV